VQVGLAIHACDVTVACWAHGCYAVDEPSNLCMRYVLVVLALTALWPLLTHWLLDAVAIHELSDVVARAHTFYAAGHIAVALGFTQFLLDGASTPAAKCEETLTGVPAPLEAPMLFAPQDLHFFSRVCRNLVLSFLATAQPTTKLHRGLNVALTIGCVVLSEPHASSLTDVRVMASVFGALLPYLGLHGTFGASWQREHVVAQLEMRRRAQLQR
jgi:hypothetical protein